MHYKLSAALCHHQSKHFRIQFPFLFHQKTFVCLLYLTLKTFYSLFQIAFSLLVSLTAKRISSTDIPATATCKEKLLTALQNSLLFVLFDIRKQNILMFDEEWVGRLPDFPTIGVVERNV